MPADDPLARLAFDVLRSSAVPLSDEDLALLAGLTPLGSRVALWTLRATPGVCKTDAGWMYVGTTGATATWGSPD